MEHGKYHISTVAEEADSVSVTRTLKIKNAEVRDRGCDVGGTWDVVVRMWR